MNFERDSWGVGKNLRQIYDKSALTYDAAFCKAHDVHNILFNSCCLSKCVNRDKITHHAHHAFYGIQLILIMS